jgi:hypothetical protein
VASIVDTIRKSQLEDQFSPATRTVRRNLLIASSIALLLGLPGITLGEFVGIDLSGPNASSLAVGAVAAIAAFELVSFVTYALIDHSRWRIEPGATRVNAHEELLRRMENYIVETRLFGAEMHEVGFKAPMGSRELDRLSAVLDEFETAILNYRAEVRSFHSRLYVGNLLQIARTYLLDWGVPLALGALCFCMNWGEIKHLLAAFYAHAIPLPN